MSSHNTPRHDTHNTPRPGPSPGSLESGYELRDVNIRAVLWLGFAIALTMLVVSVGLYFLLDYYEVAAKKADPELSPLAAETPEFPSPRLRYAPALDLQEFRRAEEQTLASYGWVNREQGVVHIPVAQAMDLLLERGLPTPTGPVTPQQEPSAEEPPRGAASDAAQPPQERE